MSVTREALRQLVDEVDSGDINLVYQILVRFTPEVAPLGDEIAAISEADESIRHFGVIDYEDVNWD
ncbi:MAG: hypothetical protein FWD90_07150 [Defluviitaleaceae bacterium]|nr:hypothetical protein [Defluviitaleaceae bacterium]